MANNNKENRMSIDDFDFAHEDAIDDTPMSVNYLVTWLQQGMGNPALQGKVQQQLHAYGILPPPQQERDREKSHGETSKRGLSMAREVENPYQVEKGVFKGKNKLTSKELERYHKENKCFKCGEQGPSYCSCLQRNPRNEQPRASMVEAPKEDVHFKGSPLSYDWGKVKEHDAFILFDTGFTHNFISLELATKLGVQDLEMGDAMKADGAFIGQDVSVTPLIEKLRIHIQGYVDKEDIFISPLKHEDVILGAPWFDRLTASIKFPERKISFKFREKDMYINAQESGSTIPLVNDQDFDKISVLYLVRDIDSVTVTGSGLVTTQSLVSGLLVSNSVSGFLDYYWLVSGFLDCDCDVTGLVSAGSGSGLDWLVQVLVLVSFRTGLVTSQWLAFWFWLVLQLDWLLVSAVAGTG
ncbi:hypothetical protein L7F22_022625 [Adiantum nelumboides]|nr:hypothetical protein [Adiantum nelumboides]